jgi:hypothetical protein
LDADDAGLAGHTGERIMIFALFSPIDTLGVEAHIPQWASKPAGNVVLGHVYSVKSMVTTYSAASEESEGVRREFRPPVRVRLNIRGLRLRVDVRRLHLLALAGGGAIHHRHGAKSHVPELAPAFF